MQLLEMRSSEKGTGCGGRKVAFAEVQMPHR